MIKMLSNIQQKSGFLAKNVFLWTNMKENSHENRKVRHIIGSKLIFMVNNTFKKCVLIGIRTLSLFFQRNLRT